MAPKPKRAYGTGGITYDAKRDRYVGTLEAGWTAKGTRRRRSVTGKTEAIVRRKLRDALRESEKATVVVGSKPTVKVWADTWLENTSDRVRPTTWQSNKSQVSTWIIPTIGHRRLADLRPADARAVERAMTSKGLVPSSIARCLNVLKKMLKDAIIEGHDVPPGILLVESVSAGESDRDAIPTADALLILEAASREPDASRWVAALLNGMRPAECHGLTWDAIQDGVVDVSWQLKPLPYRVAYDRTSGFRVPAGYVAKQVSGRMHLVRPKTAAGRRLIPLVPWMVDALQTWRPLCAPTKAGFVWPGAGGKWLDDKDDRAAWVRLQDAAQVARVDGSEGRRYDLYEARHTTATLLRELGADDATITAIVGHASILSTKAYLHTDQRKTRAALEAVAGRLALGPAESEG
jgi:integrase